MEFGVRDNYLQTTTYIKKDDCPFCTKKHLVQDYMITQTLFWEVVYNKYPYYGYKQNLVVYPKSHKIKTSELSDEELIDYKNIELWMEKHFNNTEYFSFIRQSTLRSIEHLHYHYLEGSILHTPDNDKNQTFKIINVTEGKT